MKRVRDTAGGATTISQDSSSATEGTTDGSAADTSCLGGRGGQRAPPSTPAAVASASASASESASEHEKLEAVVRHHGVYHQDLAVVSSREVEGGAAPVAIGARSREGIVVSNHDDDDGIQQGDANVGGGSFGGDGVSLAPAEGIGRDSGGVVTATAAAATATVGDGKEAQGSCGSRSSRKRKARGLGVPGGVGDESKPAVRRSEDGGNPHDRCGGKSDSSPSVATPATPALPPDAVARAAGVAAVAPTSRVSSRTEQTKNGDAAAAVAASLPPPSRKRKNNSQNEKVSAAVAQK